MSSDQIDKGVSKIGPPPLGCGCESRESRVEVGHLVDWMREQAGELEMPASGIVSDLADVLDYNLERTDTFILWCYEGEVEET